MLVGVPKEIKLDDHRVAPAVAGSLKLEAADATHLLAA